MMKILIVDDEKRARSLLRGIIQNHFGENFYQIEEADNLEEAVLMIEEIKPDLVLLDIEMPGEKGTEIFNHLKPAEVNFSLVFTTAYDEFALKAFEMNALDYLLKPLRPQKVIEIIECVKEQREKQSLEEQLKLLHSSLMTKSFRKIGLPLADGVEFVSIDNILQMEADGMYTKIHLTNRESKLISKPLKHFVELLTEEKSFLKPHRSHFINLRYIKQYIHRDGGYLIMENENVVPIARNRKQDVLNSLS